MRILIYLHGTLHYGVFFSRNPSVSLLGYTNYDWVGDTIHERSIVGYAIQLGLGPISWSSKKLRTFSLSSCEVQYREIEEATKGALWLRHVLTDLQLVRNVPTELKCDN